MRLLRLASKRTTREVAFCEFLSNKVYFQFSALLPIETKAAAIIILTLKLMFALDDSNEYKIDEVSFYTFTSNL